jgi:hypothetical protein
VGIDAKITMIMRFYFFQGGNPPTSMFTEPTPIECFTKPNDETDDANKRTDTENK